MPAANRNVSDPLDVSREQMFLGKSGASITLTHELLSCLPSLSLARARPFILSRHLNCCIQRTFKEHSKKMNFLHRVDKEGNKRLVPNSPQRSKNPRYQVKRNKNASAIPDLVGDKDSETSSDYSVSVTTC